MVANGSRPTVGDVQRRAGAPSSLQVAIEKLAQAQLTMPGTQSEVDVSKIPTFGAGIGESGHAIIFTLEGVVLIEFPDVAAAKAWYESPAYQKAKQHRDGAADTEFFIIDGGLVPLEDRLPHINNRQT